jgi:hypothetical protein
VKKAKKIEEFRVLQEKELFDIKTNLKSGWFALYKQGIITL